MSLIFGLSFLFIKIALESLSPLALISYRFTLAAIVLTLLVAFRIIKVDFKGKPLKMLALLSLFEPILYFIFETIGINLTSSSEAGMIIALIPVIVTVLAIAFLNERPTGKQFCSVLVSVAGVLYITVMAGSFDHNGHFIGILFLLGAVVSAGGYNILSRKCAAYFTPVEITFAMMWTAAIGFNVALLVKKIISYDPKDSVYAVFTFPGGLAVIYLGILSSVCAYFMLNYVLSKLPIARASVFSSLSTVVAIFAGIIFRHEAFYWYEIVGGLLIILGVWGTNYFAVRKIKRKNVK